jgi:hypothetical protein
VFLILARTRTRKRKGGRGEKHDGRVVVLAGLFFLVARKRKKSPAPETRIEVI